MTREEIIDFCDMKAQLEPENEDVFNAIIKALEQETVSKESYDHEYFLRKELEMKIAKLEHDENKVLDKIRAEIIERDKNVKAIRSDGCCFFTAEEVLEILDRYKAESEEV